MNIVIGFLSVIYVIACLFLIFVVLIQKGEGGGLGGAFGGGAVDVAFGSTADMTWKRATSVAAGAFIVLSVILGILEAPPKSSLEDKIGRKKETVIDGPKDPNKDGKSGSSPIKIKDDGVNPFGGGSTPPPPAVIPPEKKDDKPADKQ